MTRFGGGALALGAVLLAAGIAADWRPVTQIGAGLVALVVGAIAHAAYSPRIQLSRSLEPARVEKGQPAVALIEVTNPSRRPLAPIAIEQSLGGDPIRARLPRLRPREMAIRAYRLPTSTRGTYEIGPVELPRADPFGFCRTVRRMGESQQISVHPRLLRLGALTTGSSRNLEGPTSDSAPQGSITFHGLREYVVGDDLRSVHWISTARHGKLVVRQNVDTAQPYTVVLLDLDPARYSAPSFEEAVDVTASAVVSLSAGRAPVQLRTTAGDRVGGSTYRDPAAVIDRLTDVRPTESRLDQELVRLRRDRGGTALVVVTGAIDLATLPAVAAMRRRFDRVILVSLVESRSSVEGRGRPPSHPGVTVVEASSASELAVRWNSVVAR